MYTKVNRRHFKNIFDSNESKVPRDKLLMMESSISESNTFQKVIIWYIQDPLHYTTLLCFKHLMIPILTIMAYSYAEMCN